MESHKVNSSDSLVSIVIPAYNHGRYLDNAIQSVINQTYPNIELIVLNDGSIDETENILRRYSNKFHWETQPNIGQSNTLNKGWKMAKGVFLGYLSADDYLLPDAIDKLVNAITANNDIICVFPDFELVDPASKHIRNVYLDKFDYKRMIAKVDCPIGPGAIFTRIAYEMAGEWNPNLRQMPDYDFWLRLGLQGKIEHIPGVLAAFRIHDTSQTYSRVDADRAYEPVKIINSFFKLNLPDDIYSLKNIAQSNAAIISAQLNLRAGRLKDAANLLGEAFKYSCKNVLTLRTLRVMFNAVFNRHLHRLIWLLRRS